MSASNDNKLTTTMGNDISPPTIELKRASNFYFRHVTFRHVTLCDVTEDISFFFV